MWRAFHRLHLPPKGLDFIFTCLWKKLPVGKRLQAIFPTVPSTCPLDGAVEDMYHVPFFPQFQARSQLPLETNHGTILNSLEHPTLPTRTLPYQNTN